MIKLTKKTASIYKQKWQQVELMQIQELQTTSMSLKFKQLCFLMNSFRLTHADKKRNKEVAIVRRRWISLKKGWGNGGQ